MNQRDHLVRMANQIAINFGTMSQIDAAAATADHIKMFWDPRMKAMIFEENEGLCAVAAAAIDLLRGQASIPHQTHATEFNGVADGGRSDAG